MSNMKTEHTPGPWKIGKPNQDTFYVLTESEHIGMLPTKERNSEANAKLIAAAPEMLEALNRCVSCLEHMAKHPEYYSLQTEERSKERYDMVMSAIKKATE